MNATDLYAKQNLDFLELVRERFGAHKVRKAKKFLTEMYSAFPYLENQAAIEEVSVTLQEVFLENCEYNRKFTPKKYLHQETAKALV